MGRLTVSSKGLAWHQKGHPWIFRDDLETVQDADSGAIVVLETKNGRFLAQGFYSDRSKIAFRLVSRSPEKIDARFWKSPGRRTSTCMSRWQLELQTYS